MKNIIIILLMIPFLTNGQNTDKSIPLIENMPRHNISLTSYVSAESNNLNINFANTILFGGFITDEMKKNWINSGDETNRFNIEIKNSINYVNIKRNLSIYYFQLSDVNLLNSNFSDDLLRLVLEGNYNYQNEVLDFSNTIIRADRYQQYKIGYEKYINNHLKINTAISFLNGNHHMSYVIEKGTLFTHPLGESLDLDYEIKSLVTDTSDKSLFAGNGKGGSLDFSLSYSSNQEDFYYLSVKNLGYINWKKNSIVSTADSNFSFSGIEIEDFNNIFNYHDSITNPISSEAYNSNNQRFKSFIPAKITFSYNKRLTKKYFKDLTILAHYRWQPYEVEESISLDFIKRGIIESGYIPSVEIYTTMDTKYFLMNPGISTGGFTDNIKFHLSVSNKNKNITLGTYHLESLFNEEKISLSAYLQIISRF